MTGAAVALGEGLGWANPAPLAANWPSPLPGSVIRPSQTNQPIKAAPAINASRAEPSTARNVPPERRAGSGEEL